MDTFLFDLDGTLLPMDQEEFVKVYFSELGRYFAALGFEPQTALEAVSNGTKAMFKNTGEEKNDVVFWRVFQQAIGEKVLRLQPQLESFYENEFHKTKIACRQNPHAAPLIKSLRQNGKTVVLATNALFPLSAIRSRLSWIGLAPEDFDHVTTYADSSYCKPNPAYYSEILEQLGKPAESGLMIGNDVQEDGAATRSGLQFYLVTDCLLNRDNLESPAIAQGDFATCCAYVQENWLLPQS